MTALRWILTVVGAAALLAAGVCAGVAWSGGAAAPTDESITANESQSSQSSFPLPHAPADDLSFDPAEPQALQPEDYAGRLDASNAAGVVQAAELQYPVQSASNLLQRAQDQMLEGTYASAHRILSALLPNCTGEMEAQVRFRLGLCSELLGHWDEAQREYSQAAAAQQGTAVGWQSVLGQARVFNSTRRRKLAADLLYKQLTRNSGRSAEELDAAWHLLASALAGTSNEDETADPLQDDRLFGSHPVTPILDILAAIQRPSVSRPDAPAEAAVEVVRSLGRTPEDISVRVFQSHQPIQGLLHALARQGGWQLELSPGAVQALRSRTCKIDSEDIDIAFLLDAVLTEFELAWRCEDDRLSVFERMEVPPEEQRRLERSQAGRALQHALTMAPGHPWACHSYLALGRLAARDQALPEALRLHQQAIDLFPNAECRVALALNTGKLLLRMGEREEALQSFYHGVDSGDADPLQAVGYLYIGRMHLENNEADRAIPSLMRALALSQDLPLEGPSAGMLASAFLLNRHPHAANEILMKRRTSLSAGVERDQAAFLSSLARYDAAIEVHEKRRELATLVEASAHLDPRPLFGGHWWVLVIRALRDAGMVHEAERLQEECLRCTQEFPLRDALLLEALARHTRSTGAPEVSRALEAVAERPGMSLQSEVLLLNARTAHRNGRDEDALLQCRALASDASASKEIRRDALQLMGRIYQHREDFDTAVKCYAGIVPKAIPIQEQAGPAAGGETR